jgi:DNA-directed RNA polymerase subunit RPC12/RpoP
MDILFKCTACDQELSTEPAGAGTTIQCPACGESLVIPSGPVPPIASAAGAKEEKHFAVPQHAVTVALIEKPLASLEAAAHADKKVRVRTMRHSDCVEVGKDHFDEKVTAVLQKIGEANIISLNTVNYTHLDLASRQLVSDYGVLIVYRG